MDSHGIDGVGRGTGRTRADHREGAAAQTRPAKAGKVEGAAAVRTTPADLKKGTEKSDDGCGHGKMAASDA